MQKEEDRILSTLRGLGIQLVFSNLTSCRPRWLVICPRFAVSLRDDMRAFLPEILPKFISLFQEAEREGSYQMVQPALTALEALGPALEDHLQLLLPALVRLVPPGVALAVCLLALYLSVSR